MNDKHKSFIVGDTNIDLLKLQHKAHSHRFYNELFSASFLPLITLPTRLSVTCDTLIDNIFTNQSNDVTFSGILSSHFSDHNMYFTSISSNKKTSNSFQHLWKNGYPIDCIRTFPFRGT